jgi:hypothetical protein
MARSPVMAIRRRFRAAQRAGHHRADSGQCVPRQFPDGLKSTWRRWDSNSCRFESRLLSSTKRRWLHINREFDEVVAGLVDRVSFHSAETGFCVLRLKARGQRDSITLISHATTISTGEFVQASGPVG